MRSPNAHGHCERFHEILLERLSEAGFPKTFDKIRQGCRLTPMST